MADPIDRVLEKLDGVRPSGDSGRQWEARCPAHPDARQSLGVARGDTGNVLLHCHAGCTFADIVAALGLATKDLFADGVEQDRDKGGITVARLAWERRIPADFLKEECGLRDDGGPGHCRVLIPYRNSDGKVLFERSRFASRAKDGTRQPKGVKLVPYGLWLLPGFRERGGPLVLVEGESDCWALWHHGVNALGLPGANAGSAAKRLTPEVLAGFPAVVAWREPDQGGVKFVEMLRKVVPGLKVAAAVGVKDPCSLHQRDPDGFKIEFGQILERAGDGPAGGESGESGESLPTDPSRKNRKRVQVHDREYLVNDEATKAMVNSVGLYQRSNSLVRVLEQEADSPETAVIRRVQGSPIVSDLSRASLREELTRVVEFHRVKRTKDGEEEVVVPPPDFCVAAVWDRKAWPGVPHLRAVVSHPVLLPDARILAENGFDPASGLFLHMSGRATLDVPDRPTHGDAVAAIALLLDVVADFPFASDAHKAAWVASLLTPAAWFAFAGPAPFFLVNGNCRGAGKGLLVDVAGLILTGRRFSVMSYDHDATELRKRITSLAAEGERLVLLDNLTGNVGNGTLDAALTGETWRDRILGVSRMFNGPLNVVWYGTGNNVVLCGDTPRRTCEVRLETEMENPEERTGFRHPDLRGHVLGDRSRLLSAVMTVLRAWAVAGKPRDKTLTPWGSYEGWSDVVRQAVLWAGMADPGLARMSVQASADPAREAMGFVFKKLLAAEAAKKDGAKKGHTSGEIVEAAKQDGELRGAIEDLCGRLDTRSLGNRLKHFCRTPIAGYFLDRGDPDHQAIRWVVRPVTDLKRQAATIGSDSPDSSDSPLSKGSDDSGGESDESGESLPIVLSQKNSRHSAGSNGTYPPPGQLVAGETKARDGESDPSDREGFEWQG